MNEIQAVQKTLYEKMTGNVPLMSSVTGVHADMAPQEADRPYITFQVVSTSSENRYGTDMSPALITLSVLCKVTVDGQDQTIAASIAEKMDTVLSAIRYYHETGWILDCYRDSLFYMPLFQDSQHYRQAGGRYSVLVRPAI